MTSRRQSERDHIPSPDDDDDDDDGDDDDDDDNRPGVRSCLHTHTSDESSYVGAFRAAVRSGP